MNEPDISVVIPVYNNAATITEQLDAIHRGLAGAPPTELIVVDNRSTDGSAAVVAAWSDATSVPVRVVPAAERAGEPYPRNVGLRSALGRNILYCDGDDVVDDGWVAAMNDGLESYPYVTGPVTTDLLNPPWIAAARGSAMFDGLQRLYDEIPYAHGCNMGFRGEMLRDLGGFDESFLAGCDQVVAVRAWERGDQLGFVPDAIVHYRLRPDLRSTFRQGRTYGRYRVRVRRLTPQLIDHKALRRAQVRRCGWLVRRSIAALLTPETRARWIWVSSQILGEAQGGLEARRG